MNSRAASAVLLVNQEVEILQTLLEILRRRGQTAAVECDGGHSSCYDNVTRAILRKLALQPINNTRIEDTPYVVSMIRKAPPDELARYIAVYFPTVETLRDVQPAYATAARKPTEAEFVELVRTHNIYCAGDTDARAAFAYYYGSA